MGRRAEGWSLKFADNPEKVKHVRFTYEGRRYDLSTGQVDLRMATQAATKIYSEICSGTRVAQTKPEDFSIAELAGEWISQSRYVPKMKETAKYHALHISEYFETVGKITETSSKDYTYHRLTKVSRETVTKELSSLRQFLLWCRREKYLQTVPVVASVPKKVSDNRDPRRKRRGLALSEDQIERFISLLPEFSNGKGSRRTETAPDVVESIVRMRDGGSSFETIATRLNQEGRLTGGGSQWTRAYVRRVLRRYKGKDEPVLHIIVRDFFIVLWETGLRPITLFRLEVPRHYRRGESTISITADIDKNKFERILPISLKAQQALERVCPKTCHTSKPLHIFQRRDYRSVIRSTAQLAGFPQELVRKLSLYDFRHSRGTHWVQTSGNLLGTAYQLGHLQVTTTNRYVHPNREAGESLVRESELNRQSE